MFRLLFALAFVVLNQVAAHALAHEETASMAGDNTSVLTDETDERHLLETVWCPGGGPLNPFYIEIAFIPQGGFNTSMCTTNHTTAMSTALNALLHDYGVGRSGVGDSAAFLAEVCSTPAVSNRRRLRAPKFKWPGLGVCRYCKADNFDARRMQWNDPNWFKNIYAPELQNKLRNAITNTLVVKFIPCLGRGPQVNVLVKPVPSDTPPVC